MNLVVRTFLVGLALVFTTAGYAYPTAGGGTVTATKAGSSGYSDGVTWSVSPATLSGTTWTYNWSTSGYLNVTGGASYSGGFIKVTGGAGDQTLGSNSGAASGTFTCLAGVDFHVEVKVWGGYRYQDIVGTATTISPAAEWDLNFTAGPAAVKYRLTVNIPANTTEGLLRYHINQNGSTLQTIVTEPGQGPQIIQLTELDSNLPVTVQEVSYVKEIDEDPLNPGHYIVVSTQLNEIRTVSTGTPKVDGATASTPDAPKKTLSVVKPAPSITPTPTPPIVAPVVPTPVPVTPVAPLPTPITVVGYMGPPTPNPAPNPTPSGTGGTTAADTQLQTNQINAALNNQAVVSTMNTNKLVESSNTNTAASTAAAASVVGAINMSADSTTKSINAVLAATNQSNQAAADSKAGITDVRNSVNAVNANLDAIRVSSGVAATAAKEQADATKASAATAAEQLAETKKITQPANVTNGEFNSSTALSSSTTAANQAGTFTGPQPGTGTDAGAEFGANNASSASGFPTATLTVGDREIVIGELPEMSDGAMAVLRAARAVLLVALCIWFVRSSSDVIERYVIGLGSMGPSSGALVGVEIMVPGVAQAKNIASAAAITAVGLTACAAIVALVDTVAARYGLGIVSLFNALDLAALGPGIAWLDQYVPIAASCALVTLRAGVGYLAGPIYLIAANLSRFLHV